MSLQQEITFNIVKSIPVEQRTDAKMSEVKYKVSDILLTKLKGRVIPTSKMLPTPRLEGLRLMRENTFHTYPRKLKTDKQKFFHLKNLFQTNSISKEIFIDLLSVLKIKQGLIDAALCPIEVVF